MSFFAANRAIENAEISKNDIDLIVLATTTPGNTFPSTATLVQKKLEIKAVSFDIQAVCAGFVFALSVAKSMMLEGMYKNCLEMVQVLLFFKNLKILKVSMMIGEFYPT